ncbi:MAG TPA: cytochrome c [Thermoanaerobaculia bacterium]|nr:cytochrome c [Thermoanaerobaculia bacterium]
MSPGSPARRRVEAGGLLTLSLLALTVLAACRPPQKMADQPAYRPFEATPFFADGMSARQPVEGTIPRGDLRDDSLLFTGKVDGQLADAYPFEIERADLQRGRERYDIFCAPCHGQVGLGDGMIVRRGYRRPPSFHTDLQRDRPAGHYFDVITHGFGTMPPYAAQIPVRDRWLITAYVRALQLSQNAQLGDVPPADRSKLRTGGAQ